MVHIIVGEELGNFRLYQPGFSRETDPMGYINIQKGIYYEGMETQSSILAWKIPWTEEPGGLQRVAKN